MELKNNVNKNKSTEVIMNAVGIAALLSFAYKANKELSKDGGFYLRFKYKLINKVTVSLIKIEEEYNLPEIIQYKVANIISRLETIYIELLHYYDYPNPSIRENARYNPPVKKSTLKETIKKQKEEIEEIESLIRTLSDDLPPELQEKYKDIIKNYTSNKKNEFKTYTTITIPAKDNEVK